MNLDQIIQAKVDYYQAQADLLIIGGLGLVIASIIAWCVAQHHENNNRWGADWPDFVKTVAYYALIVGFVWFGMGVYNNKFAEMRAKSEAGAYRVIESK